MNFFKQLEGPELKMPSLQDEPEQRALGFKPLAVTQPIKQWYAMPAPDGTDTFTPFFMNQPPRPQQLNRRFGHNDEGSQS